MEKILMISTGGTISSSNETGSLQPKLTAAEILNIVPEISDICEFSYIEPFCIDSSNISPDNWITLASIINDNIELYSGFVITHGTDTMAYTAAALSYILRDIKKPVILTGSQLPITEQFSDAPENLLNAFRTALLEYYPGVYIVFSKNIYNARQVTKIHTSNFKAFSSITKSSAGIINDSGQVHYFHPFPETVTPYTFCPEIDKNVLLVKLYPGFNPETLLSMVFGSSGNLIPKYKGVVIEAFGAGGIPSLGDGNLLTAIRKLYTHNVVVCCKSQCTYGFSNMSLYKVGVDAVKEGAICITNISTEAALTKLMWALGSLDSFEHVCSFMRKPE